MSCWVRGGRNGEPEQLTCQHSGGDPPVGWLAKPFAGGSSCPLTGSSCPHTWSNQERLRDLIGPHSGTYGMGYKAVQPLLEEPQISECTTKETTKSGGHVYLECGGSKTCTGLWRPQVLMVCVTSLFKCPQKVKLLWFLNSYIWLGVRTRILWLTFEVKLHGAGFQVLDPSLDHHRLRPPKKPRVGSTPFGSDPPLAPRDMKSASIPLECISNRVDKATVHLKVQSASNRLWEPILHRTREPDRATGTPQPGALRPGNAAP